MATVDLNGLTKIYSPGSAPAVDRLDLHINHGEMQITSSPKKFSGYFHFYRKHKDKFDRASRKYQLFTLYQIRNKRMNWRTLLTLLSIRNGKRLADGLRGK